MALTKAQITKRLYEEIGLNQREAKDMVEGFFEEVRAALESGRPVKLSRFGRFDLQDKKERPGRNPKTGKEAVISARRVIAFHPGVKLRERVEGYSGMEGG